MERREFMAGVGALAATGILSSVAKADDHDHQHMHGGAKPPAPGTLPPTPPITKELRAVIDASSQCLRAGQLCLAHCTDNLASGDASMAECQRGVMNMLAVCDAMSKVASYRNADPKNIKALARTCADFCRACAKACEPHSGHHEECKNCMESCKACSAACDTLAA